METLIKLPNSQGHQMEVVNSALQTIILSIEVYAELMEYTRRLETEVSGCGMVNRTEEKIIIGEYTKNLVHTIAYEVTEIFLPPKQTNTYSSTEIEETAIAELIQRLITEGKDPSKLKLHWHSHVNMNTFHSGTDEENYSTLDNKEYLVSLVLNKKKEVLGRVDIYSPVTVSFINVPVFVGVSVAGAISQLIDANIEALNNWTKEQKKGFFPIDHPNQFKDKNKKNKDKSVIIVNGKEQDLEEWKREQKIRNKLCKDFNVSEKEAFMFEKCRDVSRCPTCFHKEKCDAYLDEFYKRVWGRGYVGEPIYGD